MRSRTLYSCNHCGDEFQSNEGRGVAVKGVGVLYLSDDFDDALGHYCMTCLRGLAAIAEQVDNKAALAAASRDGGEASKESAPNLSPPRA